MRTWTIAGAPPLVMADSGAYTALTMGLQIDLGAYAEWVSRWVEAGVMTSYANLDVIGDPAATAVNQQRLEDLGLTPLPVFHGGSDMALLRELCQGYDYVGLGGVANLRPAARLPWLIACLQLARDHGTRLHGFGIADVGALHHLPLYSVDSSSWGGGVRYGRMPVWDGRARRLLAIDVGDVPAWYRHAAAVRALGFDPADFAERDRYRRKRGCALSAVSYWLWLDHLGPIHDRAWRAYLDEMSPAARARASGEPPPEGLTAYLSDAHPTGRTLDIAHGGLTAYLADTAPIDYGLAHAHDAVVAEINGQPQPLTCYLVDGSYTNLEDGADALADRGGR